jgi:ADP-dependent NAD(P)H-hydrate dehydratase
VNTPEPTIVTPAVLRDWKLPEPGTGKEARGHLLVIGGTTSTPGAVQLAGEAALRAGAGKLQIATPGAGAAALAVSVPEALVVVLPENARGSIDVAAAETLASYASGPDAVLIGSGFVDPGDSEGLIAAFAADLDTAVVVDAIGSAFLTEHPEGLAHLGGRAVLAVNHKELAITADCDPEEVERDPRGPASRVAERSQVVVVAGGAKKHVVTPDGRCWVIEGGGPGLGVSGSGDVQAGILSGLLARGADPAQAAVWGGYLHARTGERLAAAVGVVGYLARELPGQVPAVLGELA